MANHSKNEDLYIIMEPGFESVCGFDRANVVMHRQFYGHGVMSRAYPCYKVQGPVGSNQAYWNWVRDEEQKLNREARCPVPSPKDNHLIRCPEENKCARCPKFLSGKVIKEKNRPASMELIAEKGIEARVGASDRPNAKSGVDGALVTTNEEFIVDQLLLKELVDKASELSPQHGAIFQLMLEGLSQNDIGEEVGLKQRTVSNRIKDIRKLLTPVVKELLNR